MKEMYLKHELMLDQYSRFMIRLSCHIYLSLIAYDCSHLNFREFWYAFPVSPQLIMAIYDYDLKFTNSDCYE